MKRHLSLCLILALAALLTLFSGCKLQGPPEADTSTPSAPSSSYNPGELHAGSGHADETSEAFRHWDEDDPPLVPTSCAKCHSQNGFLDWVVDGVVDEPAEPATHGCRVCHSNVGAGTPRDLGSVTFPSGITVENLGTESICMQCHQGRSSGPSVDEYIAGRGVEGDDTVSSSFSFRNVHYFATGATMFGGVVKGGYEYSGMTYDARLFHVEGYQTCADCHDPHSLQIKTEECMTCHYHASGGEAEGQAFKLHNIRSKGSKVDYDGDGNYTEGIYYEIDTLKAHLYNVMYVYSQVTSGSPMVYDSHTYPYFFNDSNGNGVADPGEANYGNRYRSFTARLLKAAYNYQFASKDPGGFAHGGKYMIQLLYDSIMDLNGALPAPLALPLFVRGDEGHFDGSVEAWRHWDEDGEVSASCAKCHSADGLPYFLEHGETVAGKIANGMPCSVCHTDIPAVREVADVTFPSGAKLSMSDGVSNICLNCHQGRASRDAVNDKIISSSGPYSFTNIHYFPTAAVLFGTEAKGGYEYPGKSYTGRKMFSMHGDLFDTCVECHMGSKGEDYVLGHNVARPNPADCVICHGRDVSQPYPGSDPFKFQFSGIRPGSVPDYDGDGNTEESLKYEIKGLEDALYAQMQAYATGIGSPIIYDSHAYPYFFKDKNGNGLVDPGEAIYPNSYSFDAKLLKAAYNYQVSKKEPNGFIHNSLYVAQLLVDSIGDLGGDVSPYTWR